MQATEANGIWDFYINVEFIELLNLFSQYGTPNLLHCIL